MLGHCAVSGNGKCSHCGKEAVARNFRLNVELPDDRRALLLGIHMYTHYMHAHIHRHTRIHTWDLKDSDEENLRRQLFTHTCIRTILNSQQMNASQASVNRWVANKGEGSWRKLRRVRGALWALGVGFCHVLQHDRILVGVMTDATSQNRRLETIGLHSNEI